MTGSTKQNKPILVGVAGGSGSGKTYFARALYKALGSEACEIIYQDNFYIDQSKRFDFDGGSVNFDHPAAIDFSALAESLRVLKEGRTAQIPIYDFVTHTRSAEALAVQPKPVIIADGILILHDSSVRSLFDHTVFLDTAEDLRFSRRLERDVRERGRTAEGVRNQIEKQVKPMHDQFVEPSKAFAKDVIRSDADFQKVLKRLCNDLRVQFSG